MCNSPFTWHFTQHLQKQPKQRQYAHIDIYCLWSVKEGVLSRKVGDKIKWVLAGTVQSTHALALQTQFCLLGACVIISLCSEP